MPAGLRRLSLRRQGSAAGGITGATAGQVVVASGTTTMTSFASLTYVDSTAVLDIAKDLAGAVVTSKIRNLSNTASAGARQLLEVAGTSATGDAAIQWGIAGGQQWTAGVDVSSSNRDWVLSSGTTLGTGNFISCSASTGGVMIKGSGGSSTFTTGTTFCVKAAATAAFIVSFTENHNMMLGRALNTDVASTVLRILADKTITSAAGAVWDATDVIASTATVSGSTNITTATGFNLSVLRAPTITAASALTVTHAATLAIGGAPIAAGAGPATLTNTYALWVQSGNVAIGSGTPASPQYRLDIADSLSATITSAIRNTSNTASAGARHLIEVAGTSASGDPMTQWSVAGSQQFSAGLVTTGDRRWLICPGTTLGATSPANIAINSSGTLMIGGSNASVFQPNSRLYIRGSTNTIAAFTDNSNLCLGIGFAEVNSTTLRVHCTKSIVSGASAVWDGIDAVAVTATLTGSTNITTGTGFNLAVFRAPTISAASALTVDLASTLYISGAPIAAGAGPATITNAYSLWVDAGLCRFDGNGTQIFEVPADATVGIAAVQSGRIPLKIGGATMYVRYYTD